MNTLDKAIGAALVVSLVIIGASYLVPELNTLLTSMTAGV